jgi:hypothetical protein
MIKKKLIPQLAIAIKFFAHFPIKYPMTNYCIRWRGIFKGLSEDGGWEDSSFNKGLSNEPNFGRIFLAEQYLYNSTIL